MKYVMCCVQYEKNDNAYDWASPSDLTFHNSYCQERAILNHACPWCVLVYTHTQYKCVLIRYKSLLLGAGAGGRQSLRDYIEAIRMWSIHPDRVGPYAFEDAYLLYSSLEVGMSQWSMFNQRFFLTYFRRCIGAILTTL